MTNRKGTAIASKCLDKASACSYVNEEVGYSSDEQQRSSSSTVSDADSSAIRSHITQALSSCRECSNGSVKIGTACVETPQGIDCAHLYYRDRESTIHSTVRIEKLLRKTGWTDEKHRSYLSLMEEEFVRSLYAQDCCPSCYSQPRHVLSSDSLEEDCAESHPTINTKSYHESEIFKGSLHHAVDSRQVRPSSDLAALASVRSQSLQPYLSISRGFLETNSSRSSCPLYPDAGCKTLKTKKRPLDMGREPIDLELRLGDFRTRFFEPYDPLDSISDKKDPARNLNTRRKLQSVDDEILKKVLAG